MLLSIVVGTRAFSFVSRRPPSGQFYSSNTRMMRLFSTASSLSDDNQKQQQQHHPVRILGVCGGIGSGKSQACEILVNKLNCLVHLEADKMAHAVYEPNSQPLQEIAQEFGSQLLLDDGSLNRAELGKVVFSSPDSMARLEQIVWPHVKKEIQASIQNWKQQRQSYDDDDNNSRPIIVLEAAVLLDAGWQDLCDGLWVVHVDPKVAMERLQTFRGFSQEDAQQRLEAQQTRRGMENLEEEVQNGVVSCVIENNASLQELEEILELALEDKSNWYDL